LYYLKFFRCERFIYMQHHKNLKVFVINLKDHNKKRVLMKRALSAFSFKYEFFDAFDGRNLSPYDFYGYNDFIRKLYLGRSLLSSELGALESNRLIFKKMLEEDIDIALILEDDIKFKSDFEFILNKILNLKFDWEIIRFIDDKKIRKSFGRKIINLGKNYYIKRYPKLFGGSHAYLIKKEAALKLLNLTTNFYHHIDIIMGQSWKNNLNSLICPDLVSQDPLLNVSRDNPRFVKVKKNFLSIYPYTRFLFKIYEATAKWLYYIYKFFPDLLTFKRNS